jgi:hypothetical protein
MNIQALSIKWPKQIAEYLTYFQVYLLLTFIIKGKKPQIQTYASSYVTVKEKLPDKAWCRPLPGYAKLTVDGSFHTDGAAGTCMVLRNEYGNVIFTSCRFLEHCSGPLEAEIQAVLRRSGIGASTLPITNHS